MLLSPGLAMMQPHVGKGSDGSAAGNNKANGNVCGSSSLQPHHPMPLSTSKDVETTSVTKGRQKF